MLAIGGVGYFRFRSAEERAKRSEMAAVQEKEESLSSMCNSPNGHLFRRFFLRLKLHQEKLGAVAHG